MAGSRSPISGSPQIYDGAMHIFARGADDTVYHWWAPPAWRSEATVGAYRGNPSVFTFRSQLQTVGRGVGGALYSIWYDPLTRLWNREPQDATVTE